MDKPPKQTPNYYRSREKLQPELAAASEEFPTGREVTVMRNEYDENHVPTGVRTPESGWLVKSVAIEESRDGRQRRIAIKVVGPDGSKYYSPDQLRELNPPGVAEETIELPDENAARDVAMGTAAVALSVGDVSSPAVALRGLPPAPKIDVPAVPISTSVLPPPPARDTGNVLVAVPEKAAGSIEDEVTPEDIKEFLAETQDSYDELISDLDSNYRNGVETETIERIRNTLDMYATYLSKMFNLKSRAEGYPQSANVVNSAGEMRYQLGILKGRDGSRSDMLGNMSQLLQRSREELTVASAR